MTKPEFAELIEWLHAQWPNAAPWGPATIDTTYHLLSTLEAEDVWSGVFSIHNQGPKWRPEPAEILKAVRDFALERAQYRPRPKALPVETELLTLGQYLELRGFDSFNQAVRSAAEL